MSEEYGDTDEANNDPSVFIFIDANVLISTSSRQRSNAFDVFHALAVIANATLLTTDLTRIEVAKNLAERDCDLIQPTQKQHFAELTQEALDIEFPPLDMEEFHRERYKFHKKAITEFTRQGRWKCLKARNVSVRKLFSQYGKKQGLFSDSVKRNQFSDAIIFESLKKVATPETPVYIFSFDKDFQSVAKDLPHFKIARKWAELYAYFEIDENVKEVEGLIEAQEEKVKFSFFQSLGFIHHRLFNRASVMGIEHTYFTTSSQKTSMRRGNEFLVSGEIEIELHLSGDIPQDFIAGRFRHNPDELGDGIREVRGRVLTFVMAFLRDEGNTRVENGSVMKLLTGDLLLEMIWPGGHINYEINRVEWVMDEN